MEKLKNILNNHFLDSKQIIKDAYNLASDDEKIEYEAIKLVVKNLKKVLLNKNISEDCIVEILMSYYKLSELDHNIIGENIKKIMSFETFPVEQPIAIVNIAPPASGKTGLNGFGKNQFRDSNVIIINSDEIKPFHPFVDEIAMFYPEYFTKITDQESNTWTSSLFDFALQKKYNVIFEGTGKNSRILNTISEKMKDYKVIVRGMAVNEEKCLMSLIDRFMIEKENRGWGRLVRLDHFYETYDNMPNTIDEIEKSGIVDVIEVYKRGKSPNEPIRIYCKTNNEEKNKSLVMGNVASTAKDAVLVGRQLDKLTIDSKAVNTFLNTNAAKISSVEESKILEKIGDLHSEMEKENNTGEDR